MMNPSSLCRRGTGRTSVPVLTRGEHQFPARLGHQHGFVHGSGGPVARLGTLCCSHHAHVRATTLPSLTAATGSCAQIGAGSRIFGPYSPVIEATCPPGRCPCATSL